VPVLEQPPDGQAGRSVPLLECEINHDRRLAPAWFPYIGKEVRVYGHWVEDISHEQKTEIHPIHWLTWEQLRVESESEIEVFYRVTLFADVSGRFRSEAIRARIEYQWEKIFPTLPVQDATCEIIHNRAPQYERDITQEARCSRPQPNLFRFTCSVGGRQGADARNCNETRDGENSGGYWDGWVVFRISAPKRRRRISSRIEDRERFPRIETPRVELASATAREAEEGGLEYDVRLTGEVAVAGFDPERDRISWSARMGDDRVAIGASGPSLDTTMTVPVEQATAAPPRDLEPINGRKKMRVFDESDPSLDPVFVTATVVRGGARRSVTTVAQYAAPALDIQAEWTLLGWKAVKRRGGGELRYRVKLDVTEPELPRGSRVRWSIASPEARRIRGRRSGELLVLHRPLHRDARCFAVQAEIWKDDERVAVGRQLVHLPVPSVTLTMSKARGGKARVTAEPSGFAGPVTFQWLVEGGAKSGAGWCVDGRSVELEPGVLKASPHVVVMAFDSTGQSATAVVRV
jgi:hypothetical protein